MRDGIRRLAPMTCESMVAWTWRKRHGTEISLCLSLLMCILEVPCMWRTCLDVEGMARKEVTELFEASAPCCRSIAKNVHLLGITTAMRK